jgi:hypothetical protein
MNSFTNALGNLRLQIEGQENGTADCRFPIDKCANGRGNMDEVTEQVKFIACSFRTFIGITPHGSHNCPGDPVDGGNQRKGRGKRFKPNNKLNKDVVKGTKKLLKTLRKVSDQIMIHFVLTPALTTLFNFSFEIIKYYLLCFALI